MRHPMKSPPANHLGHGGEPAPPSRWALASLSLAMLLSALGTSITNVALPTLALAFAAPFQAVQWVVLAYLLALTTLIVSAGQLGDVMGRRRLLLAGVLLFTVASCGCAMAPNLGFLIAARAVQGLGAALMMSLTLAFVGELVPKAQTGRAMGLLGTMSAVGTALGPSVGGVLVAGLGWRAIFFATVPLGLLTFLFAQHTLPKQPGRTARTVFDFDLGGTVLLALTLAAYALALTLGRGRFGVLNLTLGLVAALGAGFFAYAESKAASPLVRWQRFRDPGLRAGLTQSAAVSAVLMATLVVGPFYLSRALGLTAATIGLVLAAGPVVAALAGVPAGRLVDRLGAERMTRFGLVGVASGCALLAAAPPRFGLPGYLTSIVVLTTSYALFQAANNTAVLSSSPPDQRGVTSGLLNLSRNLGLLTGTAALGALFALAAGSNDVATASPEAVVKGLRVTFAVAASVITLTSWISAGRRHAAGE